MPSSPITVALVDDSPRDESFVHLALATVEDIHLLDHQARHGETIASLMALKPDVLLLDVLLPRSASAETDNSPIHNDLYNILDTIYEYANQTRIIILSNCERRFDLMREVRVGRIFGYLRKYDTDTQQLIDAIRRVHFGEK